MLTVGSQDSPFNFSFCWLDPSPPFSSRPLLKYHTSWGAAPPLIITQGLPRCGLRPRRGWQQSTEHDNSSSRWPSRKGQILVYVITVIHLQPTRQALRLWCLVLCGASTVPSVDKGGGWGVRAEGCACDPLC
jgi:hypothetical protein